MCLHSFYQFSVRLVRGVDANLWQMGAFARKTVLNHQSRVFRAKFGPVTPMSISVRRPHFSSRFRPAMVTSLSIVVAGERCELGILCYMALISLLLLCNYAKILINLKAQVADWL